MDYELLAVPKCCQCFKVVDQSPLWQPILDGLDCCHSSAFVFANSLIDGLGTCIHWDGILGYNTVLVCLRL